MAAALNRLGGARAVLATITSAKAMTPVIDGLAVRGRLVVIGVDAEPIQVSPLQLIGASRSVVGHASGASIDAQDTLVRPAAGVGRACSASAQIRRTGRQRLRLRRCRPDASEPVGKHFFGVLTEQWRRFDFARNPVVAKPSAQVLDYAAEL